MQKKKKNVMLMIYSGHTTQSTAAAMHRNSLRHTRTHAGFDFRAAEPEKNGHGDLIAITATEITGVLNDFNLNFFIFKFLILNISSPPAVRIAGRWNVA